MWRAVRFGVQVGVIGALIALGLVLPETLGRNRRGLHSAPPGGDLALGPAPRGDAIGRDAATCGPPGATTAGALRRRPYLQRTTTDATAIVWTAPEGRRARVRLWRPGGAGEQTVAPAIDPVPALGAVQWIAEARGLEPGALHCYELVDGDGARVWGPVGFRTAPATADATVRAIAFGDMGFRTSDQAAVRAQLEQTPAELVLLAGDIAYPYGRAEELEDHFFAIYAPLMARLPFFPAAGNHDYLTEGGAPLRAAFVLPDSGSAEGRERWYSFAWGPLHVVVLDTQVLGPAQLAWLERDLAAATRPWRIAVLHKPPFSAGSHGHDLASMVLVHPILARHRVALALAGHDHDYERTHPVDGVTYVVTGGGGRGTAAVGRTRHTAFAAQVAHHVVLEADARALRVWAVDASGATFDTLALTR